MDFTVSHTDGNARAGSLALSRGTLHTPVFMPVGTMGAVKAMSPDELRAVGAQIILCNTYHLYLRPGEDTIAGAGGLHEFISWDGPILTDSGGFQVYSLSPLRKIGEEGVTFKSHIDGSTHFIGPRESMEIQRALGSDIAMAFDECTPYPSSYEYTLKSLELTTKWAEICLKTATKPQTLFAIVQGGVYKDLRLQSAAQLRDLNFEGYAIGGVSVGEPKAIMHEIIGYMASELPADKPRYLMGVGFPEDILVAVEAGFDMFDCVIPTRTARHGTLLTTHGRVAIRNSQFRRDHTPLDAGCGCYTCQNFTKSYLNHLFRAREILGIRLNTIHNLYFYLDFMKKIRAAIEQDRFNSFKKDWLPVYLSR
ncbi:MAG: tRNA guanosine(34) transglycosylase Tgt [Nitrospirae bacterium]|nr:tRNA guanosine(34) transglycosylase Tgt [Nitrospirota bacterium]